MKKKTIRRLLRLSKILAPRGPIPVSKSTWWAGVKSGIYPQPIKLGNRITAWRAEEIEKLAREGAPGQRRKGNADDEELP